MHKSARYGSVRGRLVMIVPHSGSAVSSPLEHAPEFSEESKKGHQDGCRDNQRHVTTRQDFGIPDELSVLQRTR
jgi:hypothetical protein